MPNPALQSPTMTTITVRPGDNTSSLAARAGVSLAVLVASNPERRKKQMPNGSVVFARLSPGDLIRVPRRVALAAAVARRMGVGDPCDPTDDDFDLAVCLGGGNTGGNTGGSTGGGNTGGGGDTGWTMPWDDGSGDSTGATTTANDGGVSPGAFTPGDPVFDPSTLPPWVKAGMDKCAAKGMDYDAVNDLCAPKGATYGPHGEPAKGSVPVDPTPKTGGSGGGGGGTKTPSKSGGAGSPTTAMTAGSKGLGALKWVLIGAGVLGLGGAGYYVYHKKHEKKGGAASAR